MRAHVSLLVLSICLLLPFASRALAADEEPELTADDKKLLDGLFTEFLFDPKGASRVSVSVPVRSVWGSSDEIEMTGWFVAGKDGKPGRVYFIDGESIAAPLDEKMKKIDFVGGCEKRYPLAEKKRSRPKGDFEEDFDDEIFLRMSETAQGVVTDDHLVMAAWLYRLDHAKLASRALAIARKKEGDPRLRLRKELAWCAFAKMVHAYMVRADDEAMAHGEWLFRLYPDEAKGYGQAEKILAEMKRRKETGTLGKAPAETWPDGFEAWDVQKKSAYLIEALDEVDARQFSQPGGVSLTDDRRVEALIQLGDAVVPDLIEVVEKDDRLTRSVSFWRDFAPYRTVIEVREPALTAIMSILRVQAFDPASTGDNFTGRGEDEAKAMAERLRTYWKEYGRLSLDERMMKVLTNSKASAEAKREAAQNLATIRQPRRIGTMMWTSSRLPSSGEPNPVVAKFSDPTVAEAILAAIDAETQVSRPSYAREFYLSAVVQLGDQRIAPELAKRADNAKSSQEFRQWAIAAHLLGEPKPFRKVVEQFRAGKIALPSGDEDDSELERVIKDLVSANSPEAHAALNELANAKNVYHDFVVSKVLALDASFSDEPWLVHPFCLPILRQVLDDTSFTGGWCQIDNDQLISRDDSRHSTGGIPRMLADPEIRYQRADLRACDRAAERLGELVVGLPPYHPLFKDADKRLVAFKKAFDRFAGNYRRATDRESQILHRFSTGSTYLPDIRPLGRATNEDDVKEGKAIFHLNGQGKPADLKLPAAARRRGSQLHDPRVLIVQAETGANGEAVYGVIADDAITTAKGEELTDIKTFGQLAQEEDEAGNKQQK